MAGQKILIFAFLTVVLTISIQQASALQCWSCNNLSAFCDDPFDTSKLTEAEKLSLIDCTDGVCVKSVSNIKGKSDNNRILNRFCASTTELADEYCKDPTFKSCITCTTDECNGAAQNEHV